MLFPTLPFAAFFALVLPVSWLLMPHRVRWRLFMVAVSWLFYGAADWRFVPLLAGSTVVNHFFARRIYRATAQVRRAWTIAAVATNLAVLAWFKYIGFLSLSLQSSLRFLGFHGHVPLPEVLLPIGISFFTFQALSYVIDTARGKIQPVSLLEFAVYLSFFPHLVAGPIVRATEFLPQIKERIDPHHVDIGKAFWLISLGLFKKVVIASYLATYAADPLFSFPAQHAGVEALFGVYAYAIQIYADFSGYTDIAIGLALLLGIQFPQNFNAPYSAASLREFWRRWHMTLSRWLRDYLYVPLGGSRRGRVRTYINLMLTMVLGGLWHGAAWTFVAWGALHGAGLAIERWRGERRTGAASAAHEDLEKEPALGAASPALPNGPAVAAARTAWRPWSASLTRGGVAAPRANGSESSTTRRRSQPTGWAASTVADAVPGPPVAAPGPDGTEGPAANQTSAVRAATSAATRFTAPVRPPAPPATAPLRARWARTAASPPPRDASPAITSAPSQAEATMSPATPSQGDTPPTAFGSGAPAAAAAAVGGPPPAAAPRASASDSTGPSAGSSAVSAAGPSAGSSAAGPSAGSSAAGPFAGSSAAGPSAGSSAAGPSAGSSAAVPSGGSSAAVPSGGSSAAVPSGGSSAAVPSGGSSAAVPSGGSSAAGPSGGSSAASAAGPFADLSAGPSSSATSMTASSSGTPVRGWASSPSGRGGRRAMRRPGVSPRARVWVGRLVTFHVVCLAWIFFRATSFHNAIDVLRRILDLGGHHHRFNWKVAAVIVGALAAQLAPPGLGSKLQVLYSRSSFWVQALVLAGVLSAIDLLGPAGIAPFIYFRF